MGNEIDSINKIQPLEDVRFPADEEVLPPQVSQVQPAAQTLSQVFENDIEERPSKRRKIEATVPQQVKEEGQVVSYWSRFRIWLKGTDSTDSASQNDLRVASQPAPIQFAPVLEEPEIAQPDHQPPLPPPANPTPPLSYKELEEGFALMSEQSIGKILEILLFYQAKIQERGAEVAQTTFKKLQELKALQEEMLNDIKEVLKKDEKVMGRFQTAQNIAFFASVVAGSVAGLIQLDILTTSGQFMAAIGQGLASTGLGFIGQGINLVATAGPFITASVTGLAAGFKAYFQRRRSEEEAKHTIHEHKDQLYGNYVEEARERIFANVESSGTTQERLIQLMRNNRRKNKLMIRQMQP